MPPRPNAGSVRIVDAEKEHGLGEHDSGDQALAAGLDPNHQGVMFAWREPA